MIPLVDFLIIFNPIYVSSVRGSIRVARRTPMVSLRKPLIAPSTCPARASVGVLFWPARACPQPSRLNPTTVDAKKPTYGCLLIREGQDIVSTQSPYSCRARPRQAQQRLRAFRVASGNFCVLPITRDVLTNATTPRYIKTQKQEGKYE